jgi:hypothetical protein
MTYLKIFCMVLFLSFSSNICLSQNFDSDENFNQIDYSITDCDSLIINISTEHGKIIYGAYYPLYLGCDSINSFCCEISFIKRKDTIELYITTESSQKCVGSNDIIEFHFNDETIHKIKNSGYNNCFNVSKLFLTKSNSELIDKLKAVELKKLIINKTSEKLEFELKNIERYYLKRVFNCIVNY